MIGQTITKSERRFQAESIVRQFVSEARSILQANLMASYLFGSYARNVETSQSDIDVLLLVHTLTPSMRRDISALAVDWTLDNGKWPRNRPRQMQHLKS